MFRSGEQRVPTTSLDLPAGVPGQTVELLQTLIRFDTTNPPGNEGECLNYIHRLLTEAGCDAQLVGRSPDRPNLIAGLRGQGEAPPLLLQGHVDVVPADPREWQHPPFEGRIVDGYVWGRGALDMKGGIAMMLTAFLRAKAEALPLPGDVVLALVSDEERGGEHGARYLVESQEHLFQGVRYAIGEFGGFSFPLGNRRFYPIMVTEKQMCVLRATVRAPGGHGALAIRGGAMAQLARVLLRLESRRMPVHITPATRLMLRAIASNLAFPQSALFRLLLSPPLAGLTLKLLGSRRRIFEPLVRNTATATTVRGGEGFNVVPGEIALGLDCRLLPGYGPDDLIAELRPILGDAVELEVVYHDPSPEEPDLGLFDTLADVLRQADPKAVPVPMLLPASTDGRFFSRLGIQSYGFLPMALPLDFDFAKTIHGPNERIPVSALNFGSDGIYQLLRRFGEGQTGPSPQYRRLFRVDRPVSGAKTRNSRPD
jgi:acetylornithine deacetylase/succinyl-diaminopimelate desuccinylase-like protein